MNGVEIILITSVLLLLMIWVWFIVLGFRTSRAWGAALIFLFPASPFLFAYRFERKTRQAIYYFGGSLAIFVSVLLYINFATSVDFYDHFWPKLEKMMPSIGSSNKSTDVKQLNLPPPTPIPEAREPAHVETVTAPIITDLPEKPHQFRDIDIGTVSNYIGNKVIITTSSTEKEGRLISVDASQVEIKLKIGGGSAQLKIPKSRIKKIQVYM